MINLTNKSRNLITPEKAASFIPVFISAGFSILLIIFFVIPQYLKSTKVNLELNGLVKKKNELNNLKSQYKIINKKFDKLNQEKLKIVSLISGKSNLDTLLAKLGELGEKNNIKFISIVPKKVLLGAENSDLANTNNTDSQVELIIDPLLVEGTKKYLIDFTFKTNFTNLLSFLREIEFQENIILLSDVNLKLIGQDANNSKKDYEKGMLEVELSMTFYGKI